MMSINEIAGSKVNGKIDTKIKKTRKYERKINV